MTRRELLARIAEARLDYMDAYLSGEFDLVRVAALQVEIEGLKLALKQLDQRESRDAYE